jgi:hypothetical protein
MECQKVKDEHRHPTSLLQPLPIPKKKWEVITMDFIIGLPRMNKKHDSIMVVVDKLTKVAHFVPMKTTHTMANIAEIFMKEIARLHGILRIIVSDRDTKFTSNFWRGDAGASKQSQNTCLAKETTGHADEEKGHIFMKTILNFETKSINVIVRRNIPAFMLWRYEQIWRNYSHLSIVLRHLSLLM